MDLLMLSVQYIQKGLLFTKLSVINDVEFSNTNFLSLMLVHFYPLAGRLVTEVDKEKHNICHRSSTKPNEHDM
ncbi:hypothetical protein RND81_02G130800 [Saponaria officinalis]|uniref:Uncharacterized protein n=1 Tax=Saponaria officinalis TaxID=3572 RepID=A0AAW1MXW3_SAPOF